MLPVVKVSANCSDGAVQTEVVTTVANANRHDSADQSKMVTIVAAEEPSAEREAPQVSMSKCAAEGAAGKTGRMGSIERESGFQGITVRDGN